MPADALDRALGACRARARGCDRGVPQSSMASGIPKTLREPGGLVNWQITAETPAAPRARDGPAGARPLPDVRLQAVGAHHVVPGLAPPGPRELRQVRERAVDSPPGWRMGIGGGARAGFLGSDLLAPEVRPREEEALLGGEPVDQRRPRLPRHRALHGFVGDLDAAQVGDVLA